MELDGIIAMRAQYLNAPGSGSSEFLPLDGSDFSIVGKKVESTGNVSRISSKKSSSVSVSVSEVKVKQTSKTTHQRTHDLPALPVTSSKSNATIISKASTNLTKKSSAALMSPKSKRELMAMEIWQKHANKDFGKTTPRSTAKADGGHKGKKSHSRMNNNNTIQEMTVGAGAGPITLSNKPQPQKASIPIIKESTKTLVTTTTPSVKGVKKKKKKKESKSKTSIVKESKTSIIKEAPVAPAPVSVNANESLAFEANSTGSLHSLPPSVPHSEIDLSFGKGVEGKAKRHSWEMSVKEVEEIIGKIPPAKKKSSERIKKKGKKTRKRKDSAPNTATASDSVAGIQNSVSRPEIGEDEIKPLPLEKVKKKKDKDKKLLKDKPTKKPEPVKESEPEEIPMRIPVRIQKFNAPQIKVVPPHLSASKLMDTAQYLARVQTYFDQLGYHRVGEPQTIVNTRLSIKHLMSTSKALIKLGHPIKCLHALILAIYFTNHNNLVERFPIHFKSKFNGKEYKHVVLGVYAQGHFGALGISRDPGLQDKPTIYTRLSELINSYYQCYNQSGHVVKELKLGQVITHDPHSLEQITWKMGKVSFDMEPTKIEIEIEKLSKKLRAQMGAICLRGIRLDPSNNGPHIPQKVNPDPILDTDIINTQFRHQLKEMQSTKIPARSLKRKDLRIMEEKALKVLNNAKNVPAPSSLKSRTRAQKTKK